MRIVCDKCYKGISSIDPYGAEDEYGDVICQDCRERRDEAAYERHQEKLMEDGGLDDSAYRRDLIQAGRGHLLK